MFNKSYMNNNGSIKIILGCMFSGKTTEIIRECNRWNSIKNDVLCINYDEDTRYGNDDKVYSHDLKHYVCKKANKLKDVSIEQIEYADLILINEGQFFDDLIETCVEWCEKYKKNIIVSGLDGDFQRKPFGKILDLIPYADSVIKLPALCHMCMNGNEAYFTWRISNETEQKVIGSDNYVALCRKHYIECNNKN